MAAEEHSSIQVPGNDGNPVLVTGATGRPETMLRPAAFMENYYIPAVEKALLKGRPLDPIRASPPYQPIATDDIGKFAALAFELPKRFIGGAREIAGSELTNPAAA